MKERFRIEWRDEVTSWWGTWYATREEAESVAREQTPRNGSATVFEMVPDETNRRNGISSAMRLVPRAHFSN